MTKTNEDISKMRETIEWGEETLLAWNNDLAKQNTNVNILEAYHLEDNNRFKVITKQLNAINVLILMKLFQNIGIRFAKTALTKRCN